MALNINTAASEPHDNRSRAEPGAGYAELFALSNFSFLRAASFPEELVEQAHRLGYSALALCDECSLSGIVRAHVAAKSCGLKLIVGSVLKLSAGHAASGEVKAAGRETVGDGRWEAGLTLVLLARTRRGYGQLSHLISCARRAAAKGEYFVDRAMVEENLPTGLLRSLAAGFPR